MQRVVIGKWLTLGDDRVYLLTVGGAALLYLWCRKSATECGLAGGVGSLRGEGQGQWRSLHHDTLHVPSVLLRGGGRRGGGGR